MDKVGFPCIHGAGHTHLDSFAHIFFNGKMWNGYPVAGLVTMERGAGKNSILTMKDGIVTRGVLYDMARLKGVPYLEPGTRIYAEDLADYEVDSARGWLLRGHRGLTELSCFDRPGEVWGWMPGVDNYRVVYTAGYTTVPEDVQEACAQWVAHLFWQSKENPAIHPDSPTATVAFLLDHYRRYTAGRVS